MPVCPGLDQRQEGQRHGEVEEPVGHGAERGRVAPDPQGVDLGVQQPEDRAEADRERGDEEHQAADRDDRWRVPVHRGRRRRAGRARATMPATPMKSSSRRPACRAAGARPRSCITLIIADAERGEDRRGVGVDAGVLDDRRRVVDDRVDAGDLLEDGEADADEERGLASRGGAGRGSCPSPRRSPPDLVELLVDRLLGSRADSSSAACPRPRCRVPIMTSQRGLCGQAQHRRSRGRRPGRAPTPSIQRQPSPTARTRGRPGRRRGCRS